MVGCDFQQLHVARHPTLNDLHGDRSTINSLCLEDDPKLRRVDFSRLGVREFRFEHLPRLEWLHLSILEGSHVDSAVLHDLARLEHLALIGITAPGAIEGLAHPVPLPATTFQNIHTFRKLNRLDVSGIEVPASARETLDQLRNRR